MAAANTAKNFVIAQVNPKFKEYNRPFMLALFVGGTTMALTAFLFVFMYMKAELKSGTFIRDSDLVAAVTQSRVRCVSNLAEMVIDTKSGGTQLNVAGPNNFQFARAQTCKLDGITFCADFQSDLDASENFQYCGTHSAGAFPMDDVGSGNGRRGIYVAEYEFLPDMMTTFGVAFGYAGFLELLVTIVFTFVLTKCGCLSGGQDSYMAAWVKEVIEGKDTAKEIAGIAVP